MSHRDTATMRAVSAFTHQHCRCYYRLRTAVRVAFWAAVGFGICVALGWLQRHGILPDDFADTMDSLTPRR